MSARLLLATALLAAPMLVLAKDDPDVIALNGRLAALQANPDSADAARYERLQAQQAINTLAEAKRRDHDEARFLADRRVEIAEIAVRTALARRELDRLEQTRNDLLIEASRRDAARARQEAERLRLQSQMQAEEAEQLRQAAEAETLARQDAEQALNSVAARKASKISADQQKAAQLAREEAELMSGAKLPASRFEARGEVFSVPAASFGKDALSDTGSAKALAEYLQIGKKGRVTLLGYGADAGSGKARAQSMMDALVAAGVSASRLQVSGSKAKSAKSPGLELVVVP